MSPIHRYGQTVSHQTSGKMNRKGAAIRRDREGEGRDVERRRVDSGVEVAELPD